LRRIQALARTGWPLSDIAAALGLPRVGLDGILGGDRIENDVVVKTAALYDHWWEGPPAPPDPAAALAQTSTVQHARDRGWAPPMAWDDDQIDDPKAKPSGVRPFAHKAAHRRADIVEDLQFLLTGPGTAADIAARLGYCSTKNLIRALGRWCEPQLADCLRHRDPAVA
jgi:hypothetical protein